MAQGGRRELSSSRGWPPGTTAVDGGGRFSGDELEAGVGEDEAELVDSPPRCGDGDGRG